MQTGESFGQSLVIFDQPAEAIGPGKRTFHNPTPRQKHPAAFGRWQFDHPQYNAVFLRALSRIVSCVTLIHPHQLDALSCDLLHLFTQFLHLGAVALIGARHTQGQQMPQSVYGDVNLTAVFLFSSVVARAPSALSSRVQRARVHNGGAGLGFSGAQLPQHRSHIMGHLLEHARFGPALGLLINDLPRRKIMGQVAPGASAAHHVTHRVEHFALNTSRRECLRCGTSSLNKHK